MAAEASYANAQFAVSPAPMYGQHQQSYQPGPHSNSHQKIPQYASHPQNQDPAMSQASYDAPPPYYGAPAQQQHPSSCTIAPQLQPPAASVYGNHIRQNQQAAPSYTTHAASFAAKSHTSHKITYVFHLHKTQKSSLRNKFKALTWTVHPLEAPHAPALYTVTFTAPSTFNKDANLAVYRGGQEIGRVYWLRSVGFDKMCVRFPFMQWPEPWNPETESWGSDAGTLNNEMEMQWVYGSQDDDTERIAEDILRCRTTGRDMQGNDLGKEKKNLEMCRAELHEDGNDDEDEDVMRIVLDGDAFGSGCKREQIDEMVTISVANALRKTLGWNKSAAGAGGSGGGNGTAATHTATEALNVVNEALNLANAIMSS